jgi:hypothetical protein
MTSASEALEPIDDINSLVQHVDLRGVITYGLEARRVQSETGAPTQKLGYMHKVSETQLEARFLLDVTTSEASLQADVAVSYAFDEPTLATERVLLEFAERVGVMAAFPFLREAIFTLAARLGVDPPVLGLLKAGEVTFTHGDGSADSAE